MQLNLFDPPPLPVGTIVRPSWPWIGRCYWPPQVPERTHVIYPYWLIHTVAHPGYEVIKRRPHYVHSGDFRMELPGAPLKYLCAAIPYSHYPEEWWWFAPKDIIDTGLHWPPIPTDKLRKLDPTFFDRKYRDEHIEPAAFEAELVAMLESQPLPWRHGELTTDNFRRLTNHPINLSTG